MIKGCRPLSNQEIEKLMSLANEELKTLLSLGFKTGFRISEILSIKWVDVLTEAGEIKECVEVSRRSMKGRRASRRIPIHKETMEQLKLLRKEKKLSDGPIFGMHRSTAHRHIKALIKKAGINENNGRIATHSMRKTFATKMHKALQGDIWKLCQAMGHSNISHTISYLQQHSEEIESAIKNLK